MTDAEFEVATQRTKKYQQLLEFQTSLLRARNACDGPLPDKKFGVSFGRVYEEANVWLEDDELGSIWDDVRQCLYNAFDRRAKEVQAEMDAL